MIRLPPRSTLSSSSAASDVYKRQALGGGLAKFGAGWAINSVGAADLAKTMGSDYAKDTLAGQIADWVQGLAGSSELAQRYPAVAAAISGGIDNSMQACVSSVQLCQSRADCAAQRAGRAAGKSAFQRGEEGVFAEEVLLSLIHISEPTRRTPISYAVFCLKKKKCATITMIKGE